MSTFPRATPARRAGPVSGNKPATQLTAAEFAELIERHGHRVLWEHASRCACSFNSESKQPHPNCPICRGLGWDYHTGQEIQVIMDGLSASPTGWVAFGDYTPGKAMVTTRPEHRPGRWHRYTLLDSTMTHSEVVERAATGTIDRLSFPVAHRKMSLQQTDHGGNDVLRNLTLTVTRLRLRGLDGLPGDVLYVDEDFRVTAEGHIDWTIGDARKTAPSAGQAYAVEYEMHPRYIVRDFPHAIRAGRVQFQRPAPEHEDLPVTVMVDIDFLARED